MSSINIFLLNSKINYNYVEVQNLQKEKYEDLRFPIQSVRLQGTSNLPEYETLINGVLGLAFSPTTMEQVYLTIQTPHNRISNTTIFPHFHWTYKTAGVGNVVWCMEYSCANINATFPITSTKCITQTANGLLKHHMTDMIHLENNLTASSMCSIRLYRDATNINDTFTQDALLLEFDIHYLSYQIGELN